MATGKMSNSQGRRNPLSVTQKLIYCTVSECCWARCVYPRLIWIPTRHRSKISREDFDFEISIAVRCAPFVYQRAFVAWFGRSATEVLLYWRWVKYWTLHILFAIRDASLKPISFYNWLCCRENPASLNDKLVRFWVIASNQLFDVPLAAGSIH